MEPLVLLGRALSDPTRVRIVDVLRGGEVCVCELVDALEMGQSTLSSHLHILRDAGLVATRKAGRWIYYRLEAGVAPLLDTVWTFHADALNAAPRLVRDRERLHKRLGLRVGGCCVVGFAPVKDPAKGGETPMGTNTQTADGGCDCGGCTSGECCCDTGCC